MAGHGGVYVPVTEQTPPNPKLSHIAKRDITTPSGRRLTLINPAYMTRQVHELGAKQYGLRGHITSLNPSRPENFPDAWETEALKAFEGGVTEVSKVSEIDGHKYMRMMRPVITEEACLKCHASQGYKLGDIRGGISVSIPMQPLWAIAREHTITILVGSGLLWLLGLAGIYLWHRQIKHRINERKRTEERHKIITETAQDAIVEAYADGTILYWNAAAQKMFGFSASEAIGKNMMDLIVPPKYHEAKRKGMAEFSRTGKGTAIGNTVELTALRKDGTEFPIELSLSSYRDQEEYFAVAFMRDITERKQAEQDLRQAKEAAETANLTKSEFLANMSHEIRTPMTAILGFGDLLAEHGEIKNAPPERVEAIQTIKRNGEYLLTIINDILDLSKIEAGKMTVERLACSPFNILSEVVSLMNVRAQGKGLQLDVEYTGAVPEIIQTDTTRLRQMLINVVANAVKFTEAGSIRIITSLSENGGKSVMQFDVVDTGIGMSDDQVTKLFQPFTQADNSTTRKFGGTGLGLTISKRLAEMLGGDISVIETKPGIGTRFRVTVATGPLDGVKMIENPTPAFMPTADKAEMVTNPDELSLLDCRVLLAEDGPDNRLLVTHFLKKSGAEISVAANGKIAIDMVLKAREQNHPFDVILMDMQMPVIDGYQATKFLRQNAYNAPIIALTAHAMATDKDKCLNAGCNDFISKPIDRKKLVETILKYWQPAAATCGSS
ncbi:MAG: PAS domain S-box protein [Planctomycetota bacterium]